MLNGQCTRVGKRFLQKATKENEGGRPQKQTEEIKRCGHRPHPQENNKGEKNKYAVQWFEKKRTDTDKTDPKK